MKYDSLILGFGKAGKTLAGTLAKRGEKVALIERSNQMYGGTCINVGCIPSKSLVNSAEEAAHHAEASFEQKAERYKKAILEKRRLTAVLREKNFEKLDSLENVTIYNGIGRFLSEKQVEVILTEGKKEVLEAEKIFINTGATPVIPKISGIEGNPYVYTSATLMDEEKLPRRLVLIGAGYIGMEFSSMYANFGSKVTVLQNGEVFLPREDRDIAEEIKKIQERHGVHFEVGANTTHIENGTVYYIQNGVEKSVEADAILIAIGRRPNTDELQVEHAGIKLTARGAVEVDSLLKTNVPNIWALGDVNGGQQFTFISLDDYRIVLSQLNNGEYTRNKRNNVAYSVFMDTPLGRVGLTEKEAQEQGLPVRVLKIPTATIPKAQVLRKTEGFLKVIIHAETHQILGAALLCPEAYELINTIKLAMDLNVPAEQLRDMIYIHPTMTEAFNELFAL